jgi:hypothetical protein
VTVRYGWLPEDRDDVAVRPQRTSRRRNLLAGGTVLALVVLMAGITAWLTFTDAHRSPRAVAEAFLAANQRHDWSASWDLLCAGERRAYGSLDNWSSWHDLAAESLAPFDEGLTATVSTVRPDTGSRPRSYVVDVELARGSSFSVETLLVVEEDGDFRACGQP